MAKERGGENSIIRRFDDLPQQERNMLKDIVDSIRRQEDRRYPSIDAIIVERKLVQANLDIRTPKPYVKNLNKFTLTVPPITRKRTRSSRVKSESHLGVPKLLSLCSQKGFL